MFRRQLYKLPSRKVSKNQVLYLTLTPINSCRVGGGRSSVVSALEFKSEDPGFDPLMGQGEGQFFLYPPESSLPQTWL